MPKKKKKKTVKQTKVDNTVDLFKETKPKNQETEAELIAKMEGEWNYCDSALNIIRPEWRENEEVFIIKIKVKLLKIVNQM